jgi:hypothetical protein
MSQDYTERELHLFCRGDIRTDGWKSEWRKEMERRQAEEAASEAGYKANRVAA